MKLKNIMHWKLEIKYFINKIYTIPCNYLLSLPSVLLFSSLYYFVWLQSGWGGVGNPISSDYPISSDTCKTYNRADFDTIMYTKEHVSFGREGTIWGMIHKGLSGVNLAQSSATCSRHARRWSDEPRCWACCHFSGGKKSRVTARLSLAERDVSF